MSKGVPQVEGGPHTPFPLISCHYCSFVETRLLDGICPCLHQTDGQTAKEPAAELSQLLRMLLMLHDGGQRLHWTAHTSNEERKCKTQRAAVAFTSAVDKTEELNQSRPAQTWTVHYCGLLRSVRSAKPAGASQNTLVLNGTEAVKQPQIRKEVALQQHLQM